MAATVTLTGSAMLPDGSAPPNGQLRLQLTATDTDQETRDALPKGGLFVVDLEADGSVPGGTLIWPNTAGLAGSSYHIYLSWTDDLGRRAERILGEYRTVTDDEDTVDLAALIDAPASAPGSSYARTITADQYNAVLTARSEALGYSLTAEQAAGQATASVAAMEVSAADGLAATSDGQPFAVTVEDTTDRLDLYVNDAGAASLLIEDYLPPQILMPSRAAAPAALPVYAAAERRGTVTLRQVVGRDYRPTDNATGLLNAATPYLGDNGLTLIDPEGLTVLLTGKGFLRNGLRIEGHPGGATRFLRGGSATGINNFTFSHEVMADNLTGVHLKGITIAKQSSGMHGGVFRAYLINSSLQDITIESYTRGQAFFLGGQNLSIDNCWAYSDEDQTGNGIFRIFAGKNIVVTRSGGECYDDGLMALPAAATGSSRDNEPLVDLTYAFCRVISRGGKSCIVAVGTNTTGDGNDTYTGRIVRPRFLHIRGQSKNRPIVVGCNTSTPTERMIDQALFHDVAIEMFETSGNSAAVQLNSQDAGSIGRVTLRDVTITGPRASNGTTAAVPVNYGVDVNANGIELVLDNLNINALAHAIRARQPFKRIEHRGGEVWSTTGTFQTDPDGGGDPTGEGRTPIFLTSAVGADSVYEFHGHPIIKEVATDKQGLYAAAGRIVAPRVEVRKATGATGTRAIVTGNDAAAEIGVITGTTDSPYLNGSGTVYRARPMAVSTTATIASGVITVTGTSMKIDTEGGAASDDLDTATPPAWICPGDFIVISPVSTARKIVVKHGTGNIFITGATDRTLSYSTESAALMWTQESRWLLVPSHDPA